MDENTSRPAESERSNAEGNGTGVQPPGDPPTWLDTVEQMLDETVDREERLELVAEDLHVEVPLRMGEDSPRAEWRFDGTVRVDVDGVRGPLAEWLRIWEDHRVADRNER